jgi:hypothetical protein
MQNGPGLIRSNVIQYFAANTAGAATTLAQVIGTPADPISNTPAVPPSAASDPNAPNVNYTYDTLGRPSVTTTGPAATPFTRNTLTYTANFTVDSEEIYIDPDGPGSIPSLTRTLDRNEDTLHRSTGWDLKEAANTPTPTPTAPPMAV